jgi:hypothetical protein
MFSASEDGGFLKERLARAGIRGTRSEVLERIEEIVERRGETTGGRRTCSFERGAAVDALAKRRLRALVSLHLGLGEPAQSDFAHELPVKEAIPELLESEHFHAETLRALRRDDRAAIPVEHALTRVFRVVDVGEVLARGLDGAAVRRERHDRGVESGVEAGHLDFGLGISDCGLESAWKCRVLCGRLISPQSAFAIPQ